MPEPQDIPTTQAEAQDPYGGRSPGAFWREQIDDAKKIFEKWQKTSEKIVKKYRDEENDSVLNASRAKFNILWSNVQVLSPALYGRAAKPEVSRRFGDSDPIGRISSTILERCLEYEVEQFPDFDAAMNGVVEDRLLPGRGVAWVRYAPVIVQPQLEPDQTPQEEEATEGTQITDDTQEYAESIADAHSPCDYVYWGDFLHSPARTWEEVWWVGRCVYLTRQEGIERFGDSFVLVPLRSEGSDQSAQGQGKDSYAKQNSGERKARVWEIWNRRDRRVCWVAEGYEALLDEKEDPLELEGFFPCPKPLFATTTTGSLIPVPDYKQYQDQAQGLDDKTNKIEQLSKAIKATGVYNAQFKELGRILTEGENNRMFPVTDWGALSEKGGLKGAVDMLDIKPLVEAQQAQYVAREADKQTIYEVMGVSDLLRGATDPNETLGAQNLKANFGNLRIKKHQQEVARFASDLFRIKAQIMCKFYPFDLLVEMSGIRQTTDGQNPQQLMQALEMLRNSPIREFRIQVESDSLAQINEIEEKQGAVEAITAISTFLQQAIPMVSGSPEALPMVQEMLLFLVRRFRAGRSLEASIEQTTKLLQQKAQMAQGQPDKKQQAEMMKEQFRAKADAVAAQTQAQADIQVAQAKAQIDAQTALHKAQIEAQSETRNRALESQLESMQQKLDWAIAQLQARTDIQVAQINHQARMAQPQVRPQQ